MYDASGTDSGLSEAIAVSLQQDADRATLTMSPDQQWLTSPARQWPVTIDPTLVIRPLSNRDGHLSSGNPNFNNCATSALKLGLDQDSKRRILLRFDQQVVPANATIQSAKVGMYLDATQTVNSGNSAYYVAYPLTEGWNTTPPYATWNNRDASNPWKTPSGAVSPGGAYDSSTGYDSQALGGTSSGWKTWDITGLSQLWRTGVVTNHGVIIKQLNENTNNLLSFVATDDATKCSVPDSTDAAQCEWPYLKITYNTPPDTPTGLSTDMAGTYPILKAVFSDPDGGMGAVQYRVLDADGVQVAFQIGPTVYSQSQSVFALPGDTDLVEGQSYAWTATAVDSSGASSAASAAQTFTFAHGLTAQTASLSATSVVPGQALAFSLSWTSSSVDEVFAVACKTASVADGDCGGGAWAVGGTSTSSPSSAILAPRIDDVGSQTYYLYACDIFGNCAGPLTGSFTVASPPPGPQVPSTPSPDNGSIVATTTPTLSAIFLDDHTGVQGHVDLVIYDADGVVRATGSGSTVSPGAVSSWTVPSGVLSMGNSYSWAARSVEGSAQSDWTPERSLVLSTDTAPEGLSPEDYDAYPNQHATGGVDLQDASVFTLDRSSTSTESGGSVLVPAGSNSHYVTLSQWDNRNNGSIFNMGWLQRSGQDVMGIIDYGGICSNGLTVFQPSCGTASYSEVAQTARKWIHGYAKNPAHKSSHIVKVVLVVGTNNSNSNDPSVVSSAADQMYAALDTWTLAYANDWNRRSISNGWGFRFYVYGGLDAEVDFGPASSAVPFSTEWFVKYSDALQKHKLPLVDFGGGLSRPACKRASCFNDDIGGGWTAHKIYDIAFGTASSIPAPEIYYDSQTFRWAHLNAAAVDAGYPSIGFSEGGLIWGCFATGTISSGTRLAGADDAYTKFVNRTSKKPTYMSRFYEFGSDRCPDR
jgi:hypothetical protein